jgi:hypothetical protein
MNRLRDKNITEEESRAEEDLKSDRTSAREKLLSTRTIAAAGKIEPEPAEMEPEPAELAEDSETEDQELGPLFGAEIDQDFRAKWHDIQTGFVDEPRQAVKRADELVAQLMQHLAQSFSDQRSDLERQWEKSEKVSTEDLRLALKRYRSFFERLLSI